MFSAGMSTPGGKISGDTSPWDEAHWMREFLMELDLPNHDWSKPIVMLGDNDQATRWINQGMVTTANKSIRMNYHWD